MRGRGGKKKKKKELGEKRKKRRRRKREIPSKSAMVDWRIVASPKKKGRGGEILEGGKKNAPNIFSFSLVRQPQL